MAAGYSLLTRELRHSFLPLSLHSWQLCECSLVGELLVSLPPYYIVHGVVQRRVPDTSIVSLSHQNFGQFLKMPCCGMGSLVCSLISKTVVILECLSPFYSCGINSVQIGYPCETRFCWCSTHTCLSKEDLIPSRTLDEICNQVISQHSVLAPGF